MNAKHGETLPIAQFRYPNNESRNGLLFSFIIRSLDASWNDVFHRGSGNGTDTRGFEIQLTRDVANGTKGFDTNKSWSLSFETKDFTGKWYEFV